YVAGINVRTAAIIAGITVCIGRAERRNALTPKTGIDFLEFRPRDQWLILRMIPLEFRGLLFNLVLELSLNRGRTLAIDCLSRPATADLVVGIERYPEVIELAGLAGVAHQDLADLIGNLRPAADHEFVMHPKHDDGIAIPSVAKSRTQLVVDPDQPALANDGFA